jgi:serine/threonine-protein kinase
MTAQEGHDQGRVLDGRWRLEQLVGEGAMGQVYLGRQLNLQRPVAIKLIHPRYLHAAPNAVQRFVREARILSSLQNPHIVRLLDSAVEAQTHELYLVMELLQGETLAHRLHQGRWPTLREVLTLAEHVVLALAEAHKHKIIHRDLKPGNLFVQEQPGLGIHTTVFDFGIALDNEVDATRLTANGVVHGTPTYISPEQIDDKPCTPQTDFYALGTILYELLSGQAPFLGGDAMRVFFQKLHQVPPPLIRRWSMPEPAPPALTTLVDRMLARDPDQRPRTSAELLACFRGQRAQLDAMSSQEVALPRATSPRWRAALEERPEGASALSLRALSEPKVIQDNQPTDLFRVRGVAGSTSEVPRKAPRKPNK